MSDPFSAISAVRPSVDAGLLKIGRGLDKTSSAEALLIGEASRALSLADAIARLCRHDHTEESLPLLRGLGECALLIAEIGPLRGADAEEKAGVLAASAARRPWSGLWDDSWGARARASGIEEASVAALEMFSIEFLKAHRAVLPWGHLYEANRSDGTDAQAVLRLTEILLKHVVKGLDAHWPGSFADGIRQTAADRRIENE